MADDLSCRFEWGQICQIYWESIVKRSPFIGKGNRAKLANCRDRLKVRRREHETFKNGCIRNFEVKIAGAYRSGCRKYGESAAGR